MIPLKLMSKQKEQWVTNKVPWPQTSEFSQGMGDATKNLSSFLPCIVWGRGVGSGLWPSWMKIMNHKRASSVHTW